MLFQSFDFPNKAKVIHDLIEPSITTDPKKEFSNDEFKNAYQKTVDFFSSRPPRVEQYLKTHGF
jgi:hypothetical protein